MARTAQYQFSKKMAEHGITVQRLAKAFDLSESRIRQIIPAPSPLHWLALDGLIYTSRQRGKLVPYQR